MSKAIRFYIRTLGCPKNEVDSEVISFKLAKCGFRRVNLPEKADIILVNSCGFITEAKEETINTIFSYHRTKRDYQKIIMLGCLAQRYKGEIEKILPEVDAFVGSDYYSKINEVIVKIMRGLGEQRYWGRDRACCMLYKNTDREYRSLSNSYTYVKIADGCSNKCTFCAIPIFKGRYRSRRIDDILLEIERLIKAGYFEIGLVSQDLTAYGLDLGYSSGLYSLLKEINKLSGKFWVRLYYLYPRRIRDEVLELIAQSNKIVHYIDMPIQHISDKILRRMRRGHSSDFVKGLITKLRSVIPDVVIRSAFITGFPSETRKDFKELTKFLLDYKLDNVGFFKYSDEEGTEAYNFDKKIDARVISRRLERLYELQSNISYELNKNRVGKIYEVLIDNEENDYYIGRYFGQAPEIDGVVYIKKVREGLKGFVKVLIESVDNYDLYGSIITSGKM